MVVDALAVEASKAIVPGLIVGVPKKGLGASGQSREPLFTTLSRAHVPLFLVHLLGPPHVCPYQERGRGWDNDRPPIQVRARTLPAAHHSTTGSAVDLPFSTKLYNGTAGTRAVMAALQRGRPITTCDAADCGAEASVSEATSIESGTSDRHGNKHAR